MTLRDVAVGLVLLAFVAITLWPGAVRARVAANDAQAIGDTRTVISAGQSYASANCGRYAENLECMTWGIDGSICIPNYPKGAPEFLGPDLGRPSPYHKSGYWRKYEGFDAVGEVEAHCAPRSPRFYCYASWPTNLGITGTESFVGLAEGTILVDPFGGETGCIGDPSDGGQHKYVGSPNTHLFESEFVQSARLRRGLKQFVLVAQVFFWPPFLLLLLASIVKKAVASYRWVTWAAVGVAGILVFIYPGSLLISVPLLCAFAVVPEGLPKRLGGFLYLTCLAILASWLAWVVFQALARY